MNNEKSLQYLKEIYEYINNWLRFAELKHGTLLALNIASCIASFEVFFNGNGINTINSKIITIILYVLFTVSIIISIISFYPRTNICKKRLNNIGLERKVLIYFGDISKYSNEKEYLKEFYEKYYMVNFDYNDYIKENTNSNIELDLAYEIIINSNIANIKYKYFKISLLISVLSWTLMCILMAFYLIIK